MVDRGFVEMTICGWNARLAEEISLKAPNPYLVFRYPESAGRVT